MTDDAADPPVDAGSDVLHVLFAVNHHRMAPRPPGPYATSVCDAGRGGILKKVGGEAMEVLPAAKGQGDGRLIAEVADLTCDLLVLITARGWHGPQRKQTWPGAVVSNATLLPIPPTDV